VGMLIGVRFVQVFFGGKEKPAGSSIAQDRRPAIEAAAWMDGHSHEPITVERAPQEVGFNSFPFLRVSAHVQLAPPGARS
jgi:AraC family transcriptional regulator